jgi:hypothetical protein
VGDGLEVVVVLANLPALFVQLSVAMQLVLLKPALELVLVWHE